MQCQPDYPSPIQKTVKIEAAIEGISKGESKLRAMASPYQLFPYLRLVTEILKDPRTTLLTLAANASAASARASAGTDPRNPRWVHGLLWSLHGRASISFTLFQQLLMTKGIAAGQQSTKIKWRAPALGGKASAESDFATDDDDDFLD